MPRWLNIKIGHRILIGFGFAALLTLLVAAVSISYLRNVGQRLTSIAEQDQLLLTSALELQVAVEQESDGIHGYLLSGKPSFLVPFSTGQAHYLETEKELEDSVEFQEDIYLLSEINTLHSEFLTIAEEEIALLEQGFPQSAIFLWQQQGNEIKIDLQAKLTNFVERRQGIIIQNTEETKSQQNQALLIALTLVVVAWAAGTAGGIWISRSITRPIDQLVSATEKISRGDLTTKVTVSGKDELATLGYAMNQMVVDLDQSRKTTDHLTAQLQDLIDNLEQRVAERTLELEKLEELGRAIINAPHDASTLPDILKEYIPNMFPDRTIEIRIFPDNVILRNPSDFPLISTSVWDWLRTASDSRTFLPGEILPWNKKKTEYGLILAPIIDSERVETIGGIYISQRKEPDLISNLLPAVQSLAAQIASALHSARDYAQILAHHRVAQELNMAWRIQASFMPDELPQLPGWQLAASLNPARETSGDFYDVVPLPGEKLGIVIADVADKGVGAALYMALTRTLIRTYAVENNSQPEMVLTAVNRRLLMDIRYDMFVTVFYGILDLTSGTLTYCNAGHNPPYLLENGDNNHVKVLRRTGIALGVVDGLTWTQESVRIAAGNILLLYTDGITEAQDCQGLFFGDKRWLESLQANHERSAQEIQDALLKAVSEFVGDAPQFDDIALMVIVRGLPK